MAHAPSYADVDGPLVVAHRGGAALAPENTATAFATALATGATHLETDLRVTADGVAVAFHDERVDRVTDLRGRVAETPWSALAAATVRVPGVPGEGAVLRIEDLLGSFPDARVTVDLKTPDGIAPLVDALHRTGSAHRVCVAGAWDGWLAAVRRQSDPALSTGLGWGALSTLVACARSGVRAPRAVATGRYVHLPWRWGRVPLLGDDALRPRLVQLAADLGVEVVGWTVDDPLHARRLIDDGVRAVITDRPDLLVGPLRGAVPTSRRELRDLQSR